MGELINIKDYRKPKGELSQKIINKAKELSRQQQISPFDISQAIKRISNKTEEELLKIISDFNFAEPDYRDEKICEMLAAIQIILYKLEKE